MSSDHHHCLEDRCALAMGTLLAICPAFADFSRSLCNRSCHKKLTSHIVDAVCGGCGIHKQVTAVTWVVLCQHSTAQTGLRETRCCCFCYACRSIVRISCCACVFLQLGLLAAASARAPWKVQGCVFYTHNIISTRGMLMQDILSCTVSQAVLISPCMVGMWLAGRLWCRLQKNGVRV
jgi:hypothetical protein